MKNQVSVVAVPVADERFAGALGITTEREEEINEWIERYYDETGTYPDAIAALSTQLANANELAYAAFHLGAYAGSLRTKQELVAMLLDE